MKPVVSVAEMRAIDGEAPESETTLISRAAFYVAREAIRMMGGTYGRRVTVIAGPGNNGADGRKAAELLRNRGVRCSIHEPGSLTKTPPCDLVIDAAYGTGFHGEYQAPETGNTQVLAVDIPSGINGDTGEASNGAVKAHHTVTFAALEPGHLLQEGPEHAGDIAVCDIGLDVSRATMHVFEKADVERVLPAQKRESHKWKAAVVVVAGSPGMMGAAELVTRGAQRAGAGMVRLVSPGIQPNDLPVGEAVAVDVSNGAWASTVLEQAERAAAVVVGPGLGRSQATTEQVLDVIERVDVPLVLDGDALSAIANDDGRVVLRSRRAPTILTPHDGELARLLGHNIEHRLDDVKALARRLRSVVLSKGSTTTIVDMNGNVIFTNTGDARLATAGTGDVLAGMCGAFAAQGLDVMNAAASAAYVHGAAACTGYSHGLVAGDIPERVAAWLSTL
jgi:hydroxyethylthiazole kinase-like uncharacterized protein yjeF